jgi:DNA gyrase subunit A
MDDKDLDLTDEQVANTPEATDLFSASSFETAIPKLEDVKIAPGNVLSANVETEMEQRFLQYSMSVIVARALPDVRDGLKPVHRRILYTMQRKGVNSGGKTMKSAKIVGEVMGNYHPHGNSAIYDAMVRLAQPWSLRYPLVIPQGNFGSMYGDGAAAERYTEAKMHKHAELLLEDLDKDTVTFVDNYDGTEQEPQVLPGKLPNLLINGQMGIAVGMATNIPPHNLSEVVDATTMLIDNPESTLDELGEVIHGPDFPTGGMIYGKRSVQQAFSTGRGGVICRGIANITESKTGRPQIIVTEIPYAVNMATFIQKIADLVRDKKINGIADIRDQTSRGEIKIVIDLKKDAYPKKILNQLYKLTQLQTTFHYNMLALVDGVQPKVLSLPEILKEYIKHRQVVIRRRTEFELRKAKARAHILEGYMIALDHIDEVIKVIRASKTTEEAKESLMAKFKLSEIQAAAILEMQLRRLTGLERAKIEEELEELKKLIAKLEAILADEKEILKIIKRELAEVKEKYGDERRTKFIPQELDGFSDEDLIPNEEVAITITGQDYIKRALLTDYRKQNRGGKGKRGMGVKDADVVKHLVVGETHDTILFFTNKGRVLQTKAYEVPAVGPNAKGTALVNLLNLQPEEKVTATLNMSGERAKYLFMATKKGVIKRSKLEDYKNIRANGIIAINLDEGDGLHWVAETDGEREVILSTADGQALRFSENEVRPMGRSARGVKGMRLREGDNIVGMDIVVEGSTIVVVSENGYGKKTKVDQFTAHKRGGVGIKTAIVNAKTGKIVDVKSVVDASSELMMISESAQVIRLALKDIPSLSRTTQGVRVMRLSESDKVAGFEVVQESVELEAEEAQLDL